MTSGIRDLFEFSRAEIFALSLLLLMVLIGGGVLFYQNSTRSLPPELFIQSLGVAENKPDIQPTDKPPRDSAYTIQKKQKKNVALVLNLNSAPAESLMLIPKVGKVLSQRIIEYRKQIGTFDSVGQLIEVKGIGKKNLQTIRQYLTLGNK